MCIYSLCADYAGELTMTDRASKEYIRKIWPKRRPLAKAIRDKCMDCTGHQPGAIRECPSTNCPLWPTGWVATPIAAGRSKTSPMRRIRANDRQMAANRDGLDASPRAPAMTGAMTTAQEARRRSEKRPRLSIPAPKMENAKTRLWRPLATWTLMQG